MLTSNRNRIVTRLVSWLLSKHWMHGKNPWFRRSRGGHVLSQRKRCCVHSLTSMQSPTAKNTWDFLGETSSQSCLRLKVSMLKAGPMEELVKPLDGFLPTMLHSAEHVHSFKSSCWDKKKHPRAQFRKFCFWGWKKSRDRRHDPL